MYAMITKKDLERMYMSQALSVTQIALRLGCSANKVTYWLEKYEMPRRSISEALYVKNNPNGDPFTIVGPKNNKEWFLYGLGVGLFWGEGNKASRDSVRLGNTDPALIRYFLHFLVTFYNIDMRKLRFGLQVFSDVSAQEALKFWMKELSVSSEKFQKVVVTKSIRKGTYTKKNKYGVLTVYFSNVKLRDTILGAITKLQKDVPS